MRYDAARRPGGMETLWLRLRVALANHNRERRPRDTRKPLGLNDHLLKDIGLLTREWPCDWRDLR